MRANFQVTARAVGGLDVISSHNRHGERLHAEGGRSGRDRRHEEFGIGSQVGAEHDRNPFKAGRNVLESSSAILRVSIESWSVYRSRGDAISAFGEEDDERGTGTIFWHLGSDTLVKSLLRLVGQDIPNSATTVGTIRVALFTPELAVRLDKLHADNYGWRSVDADSFFQSFES
jgi:hypothetical protein